MTTQVDDSSAAPAVNQYITVRIGGQLFGLSIASVHEIFVPEQITRVPLAPPEIEGVLNLRGHMVTTIDLRQLLGLPPAAAAGQTAIGIEYKGEAFGLLIDEVGEVLSPDAAQRESCPPSLDPRWAEIVTGVYRVSGEPMLIVNVERALARVADVLAA